jgi:hypothetical protein
MAGLKLEERTPLPGSLFNLAFCPASLSALLKLEVAALLLAGPQGKDRSIRPVKLLPILSRRVATRGKKSKVGCPHGGAAFSRLTRQAAWGSLETHTAEHVPAPPKLICDAQDQLKLYKKMVDRLINTHIVPRKLLILRIFLTVFWLFRHQNSRKPTPAQVPAEWRAFECGLESDRSQIPGRGILTSLKSICIQRTAPSSFASG